jgi:hypothetical protein
MIKGLIIGLECKRRGCWKWVGTRVDGESRGYTGGEGGQSTLHVCVYLYMKVA